MKSFTIKNEQLLSLNDCHNIVFPKYTSQLINWANQNAQGTRPKVVGQLSDLFPQFKKEADEISLESWELWYVRQYPSAIDDATEKIFNQVENLKKAMPLITKEMVRAWVRDLVITKTYIGMYVQQAILAELATRKNENYRLATKAEESRGIDGYIGDKPYSIKPASYKTMERLPEAINVTMIYYNKTKTGLKVEVEE